MNQFTLRRGVNKTWTTIGTSNDRNELQRKMTRAIEQYCTIGYREVGASSLGTVTLTNGKHTIRLGVYSAR